MSGVFSARLVMAQDAKVTEILSKDLTNISGKEGLMITVEYPPGASDPVHRRGVTKLKIESTYRVR